MATYSKEFLSGSTNGKNISITSTTAGSPVTIHTVGSGTSNRDEIWVYACNTSASAVVLTVQFGGTTDQDDYIELAGSRFGDDIDRSRVPVGQQPDCEGARCDGKCHQRQRFREPYYCLIDVPPGPHQPVYRCFQLERAA